MGGLQRHPDRYGHRPAGDRTADGLGDQLPKSGHVDCAAIVSDSNGRWQLNLRGPLSQRLTWHASFAGDSAYDPVTSAVHTIWVVPILTAKINQPRRSGVYRVGRNKTFTVSGTAKPNMARSTVTLQWKPKAAKSWKNWRSRVVDSSSGYSVKGVFFKATGTFKFRWHYSGSNTKKWLTANSSAATIKVS
jgi:hypothetical protein